jgi:hypothetical protein
VAAGDGVAGNRGVGVANVGMRIDVVDRGRDVKLLAHDCDCAVINYFAVINVEMRLPRL